MNKTYFVIALEITLACSVALNVFLYAQYQTFKPSNDQVAFNSEYGSVLIVSSNFDFSPPITMYQALRIG